MKTIYRLRSDVANYSSFIQDYETGVDESIMSVAVHQRWKPFIDWNPIRLSLRESDSGKRNYAFDISGSLFPFYVFSEEAVKALNDILVENGQILSVDCESKKKRFFGYYSTRTFSNCLDMEKSLYRKYEKGMVVRKPVLIGENLPDREIFTIEEDTRVFVNSSFKDAVERAGLAGFDFSEVVETS